MKIPDLGRGSKKAISAALGVMAICLLLGVETGGWFERLKGMVEGKVQSGTEGQVVTGTAENLPAGPDRTEMNDRRAL